MGGEIAYILYIGYSLFIYGLDDVTVWLMSEADIEYFASIARGRFDPDCGRICGIQ